MIQKERLPKTISVNELHELVKADRSSTPDRHYPGESIYEKIFCRKYGDRPAAGIGSTEILQTLSETTDGGYRPASVNQYLHYGEVEYDVLTDAGVIVDNPWCNVPRLPLDDNNTTRKPIPEKELQVIREQIGHQTFMTCPLRFLGLRETRYVNFGTLLSAHVSDFDAESATLTLRGSIVGNKAAFRSHTPVTLHLTNEGVNIIKEQIRFRNMMKTRCTEGKWSDSPDYLFCDWDGKPINRLTLNSYIHVIQKNTGYDWFTFQRLHGHIQATEIA